MSKQVNNRVFETPLNSYTLIETIGSGGNGIVYKVKDGDGQHFALKCLNTDRFTKAI